MTDWEVKSMVVTIKDQTRLEQCERFLPVLEFVAHIFTAAIATGPIFDRLVEISADGTRQLENLVIKVEHDVDFLSHLDLLGFLVQFRILGRELMTLGLVVKFKLFKVFISQKVTTENISIKKYGGISAIALETDHIRQSKFF